MTTLQTMERSDDEKGEEPTTISSPEEDYAVDVIVAELHMDRPEATRAVQQAVEYWRQNHPDDYKVDHPSSSLLVQHVLSSKQEGSAKQTPHRVATDENHGRSKRRDTSSYDDDGCCCCSNKCLYYCCLCDCLMTACECLASCLSLGATSESNNCEADVS